MLTVRPGSVLGLPPGPHWQSQLLASRFEISPSLPSKPLPLETSPCRRSPNPAVNNLLFSLLTFFRRVSSVRSASWVMLASLHHCPVLASNRITRTWEEAERPFYIPLCPWSNGKYGVSLCQTGAAKQFSFPISPPEVIATPLPSPTIKMCPDKYVRPIRIDLFKITG